MSGRAAPDPSAEAWITVAFTYYGLKALGVPQDSLDSFAPEFRQGMAARAADSATSARAHPSTGRSPLGTPDVHVALAVLSPDAERLEAMRQASPPCPGAAARASS